MDHKNYLSEEIYNLIKNIEEKRKVPQFIFFDEISNQSFQIVRKEILEFINNPENKNIEEIDFIINSPGGIADASYRIIRTLRNNFDIVNIIIPFWAKSAATLLSLGGTKIVMDEFGEFGPLDVQLAKAKDDSPEIERESALDDLYSLKMLQGKAWLSYHGMFLNLYRNPEIEINKNELSRQVFEYVAKFYKPLLKQIDPYRLSVKARKLEIAEQYAQRIIRYYNSEVHPYNAASLVELLVHQCPDHGYVIDYGVMSKYLPNVCKTKEFIDAEYAGLVSTLSGLLMSDSGINYTGFFKNIILNVAEEFNTNEDEKENL